MNSPSNVQYSAENIQVLEGLEAVRKSFDRLWRSHVRSPQEHDLLNG
ncbi:MAG: hypothetical protein ACKO9W_12340 [Bacteroidota bacterium]